MSCLHGRVGLGACIAAFAWRACICVLLVASVVACSHPQVTTLSGRTMGTIWTVKLVLPDGASEDALQHGIQNEVDRVVAQMSTYEPDSDLSRFNTSPAGTWQTLPPEFFGVLTYALSLARDTGGAYDPTVGPLVNLWGFGPGPHEHKKPSPDEIAAARARVGWDRLALDAATHRALQPGGIYVDLSSVAKGFGTDQIARYLDRSGVAAYLVDISGELRAHGAPPGQDAWRVGVEKPGAAAGAATSSDEIERVVELRDRSIATSGDYRHFFEDGEHYYSHHIDPRSGYPVAHRIASVTTLADDCMHADSIGTAMMVLGVDAGMAYARDHDLAVLFVLHEDDGRFSERASPAFVALQPR